MAIMRMRHIQEAHYRPKAEKSRIQRYCAMHSGNIRSKSFKVIDVDARSKVYMGLSNQTLHRFISHTRQRKSLLPFNSMLCAIIVTARITKVCDEAIIRNNTRNMVTSASNLSSDKLYIVRRLSNYLNRSITQRTLAIATAVYGN